VKNYFKIILLILVAGISKVPAQEIKTDSLKESSQGSIRYGSRGFEFNTRDNRFLLQIQSRLQFRFSTPEDQDPVSFDEFTDESTTQFKINRARLKLGGHAYRPWLRYDLEYELAQTNLLNFRIKLEKWEWLKFQVGQWKIEYSRERTISSGEQQMVDRSVINRPFTIDRQQGVGVYGHLDGHKSADISYWAAVLTGAGRGASANDDNHLMYFGRLQWNFLGPVLEFEGSDIEIHERPSALVAVSGVTNRSAYTRFSQAGGGALEGYEDGLPGQYRVNQANIETALMYRGFSWQSEFHWKEIIDKLNNDQTDLLEGYYMQAGYFFHEAFEWWPEKLEFAARNAIYNPNVEADATKRRETSAVLNWFFNGHRNKLSFETSYFVYNTESLDPTDEWRFRVQWDISL
jgi:hypothetical protein